MQTRDQKIVQYLWEAHATELALTRNLQAHIAVTPRGDYRDGLERHLEETRQHARNIQQRLSDLGETRNPLSVGVGIAQGLVAQVLPLAKTPLDLVRGNSMEERLLKNAKDEAATEALEIATYDSLEHLANRVGDRETAKLARDHRAQEERMLSELRKIIPVLTDDAIRRDVEGVDRYDETTTGAADAARQSQREVRQAAEKSADRARSTARKSADRARSTAKKGAQEAAGAARRVPGVEQAEGEVRGVVASESDVPIARYDSLSAGDVVKRLPQLSQRELSVVDGYERKNQARTTVLDRIASLRGDEPWPGYDEQSVPEIRKRLSATDVHETKVAVRDYERGHKERRTIIELAERELTPTASS